MKTLAKNLWFVPLNILLCFELAFAGAPAQNSTRVEQVSAVIRGQTYQAQITQVQMPTAGPGSKTLVVNEVAIAGSNNFSRMTGSVGIEAPARLNGTTYMASVPEPLSPNDRAQAFSLAQNQVEWVRRNAPHDVAQRVQSDPAYSLSVPTQVISASFQPSNSDVVAQFSRMEQSALTNSDAAFAGIAQQEQASNMDAQRFAQTIAQGQNMTLGLRREAERSDFTFMQSLNNFSMGVESLHDRETQNLALQIAQSDPVLQNILDDGQRAPSSDIRQATSDVSPLNLNAAQNISRYGGRFKSNGLLSNGLFQDSAPFPATPQGHRLLESANMLSDAVAHSQSLTNGSPSSQLVGAGYLYLHAAMAAQQSGRIADAERWMDQGRLIARALRGENIPDDLDNAISSSDAAVSIHEQAVRDTLDLSGSGSALLSQAFSSAHPSTSAEQTAAGLGRSLLRDPHGLSDAELKSLGLSLLDVTLGMVPVVGPTKSLIYIAAGRNLITDQPLGAFDYTLCAIDVLTLGTSGPFAKIAGALPEIMGPLFAGSRALVGDGLKAGAAYIKNFGSFIEGSVSGIRDIESVAPGFALKNFATNPGAVLALGQNVSRYGGADMAKELIEYSAKYSLDITEAAHLSRFGGGFTKFVPAVDFEKYASQTNLLAGADGGRMFAGSTTEFEQISSHLTSDQDLAKYIGLRPSAVKPGGFVRVDIEFDLRLNPRLPTGMEAGANEFFKTGGQTMGGAIEVTIDPLSLGKTNVRGIVKY